jgi:hypothetical protein
VCVCVCVCVMTIPFDEIKDHFFLTETKNRVSILKKYWVRYSNKSNFLPNFSTKKLSNYSNISHCT